MINYCLKSYKRVDDENGNFKGVEIMKKTLEILGYLKNNLKNGITKTEFSVFWKSKINKAIKELEDLENRSCENCKHFTTYKGEYGTCKLGVNNRKIKYLHNSFCCNIWEQK